MPRNLDLTALRAFATVAATGGVTRAAAVLNLTQSAVSMQLKRLEEALDTQLLERTGRGVRPTPAGERALAHARQMLSLNDELLDMLRDDAPGGVIRLGVPHDIVPRAIPAVLAAFAAEFPRVKIELTSSVTSKLRAMFEAGECDVVLTTEPAPGPMGQEIVRLPLTWVGAEAGRAWTKRPVPLAFSGPCLFRSRVQDALDRARLPWEMVIASDSERAVDVTVSADLAVHAVIEGFDGAEMSPIAHGGDLPDIGEIGISLYAAPAGSDAARERLVQIIRDVYAARARPRLTAVEGGRR